jgi:hypothetical protein
MKSHAPASRLTAIVCLGCDAATPAHRPAVCHQGGGPQQEKRTAIRPSSARLAIWLDAEVGYRMRAIAARFRSPWSAVLCASIAAALVAGCTYYQVAPPPPRSSVFDRS